MVGAGGCGCGALARPSPELMRRLSERGHRVFAVGFSHKQGDSIMQAQIVCDAIDVIKAKPGADKVDLIGWSKGQVPTWPRPAVRTVAGRTTAASASPAPSAHCTAPAIATAKHLELGWHSLAAAQVATRLS